MYFVNLRSFSNKVLNRVEIKLKRARLVSKPVEIILEPTLMCNSNCLMCNRNFHRKEHRNVQGFLSWDVFNRVKPFFKSAERVVFSGFGEPLLHPEFLNMARSIKQEGPHVLFFTNALALTEDIGKGLVDLRLDTVYISLGGSTRDTYRKIRGLDGFDDVVRNIQRLTEYKRQERKTKPALIFNVVAMNSLLDEIGEIVSLAARLGVEAIDMPNLVVHGDSAKEESPWLDPKRASAVFQKTSALAERLHIGFRAPQLTPARLDCLHFFTTLFITWDGQMLTCPMERYIIGNVHDDSVSSAWNGKGLMRLRKDYYARTLASTCEKCPCWDNRSETYFDSWPNSREYANKV